MNFNDALLEINKVVLEKYPDAAFYEAQGHLVPTNNVGCHVDGTINKKTFKAVYTPYYSNGTIIGSFNEDGSVKVEFIDDIWIEDEIMTPYVSMPVERAIEILCDTYGNDAVGEGSVTLRHQIFYGEPEPRYFFGSFGNMHTVNVYTGRVDVPAGHDRLSKKLTKLKNFFKGWR